MRKYIANCHCQAVQFCFSVEHSIGKGVRCNCSFCRRLGIVSSTKIEPQHLTILVGEDYIQHYLFGDKVTKHAFCNVCGIYLFYTGEHYKVNLGCVDEIDIFALAIEVFDGKHLL